MYEENNQYQNFNNMPYDNTAASTYGTGTPAGRDPVPSRGVPEAGGNNGNNGKNGGSFWKKIGTSAACALVFGVVAGVTMTGVNNGAAKKNAAPAAVESTVAAGTEAETVCTRTGDFNLVGYIEMMNAQGELVRRDFQQKYTVVAPSATVSADLMNVLYAGYDNPMSVSVPGVAANQLQVSMTGGTLTPKGDGKYVARPASAGGEAVFSVVAKTEGRLQEMGKFSFRVRKLPDPAAFIAYSDGQGGENRFRGGKLSKQVLMNADVLGAAVDDGLLNIPFRVQGFETLFFDRMGNAVPEVSHSAQFTERQKNMFRGLSKGKRFFIRGIKAVGPDGVERTLDAAMEVIIN